MSRSMIVAVPSWGRHHNRLFLGPVLRTHRAAIAKLREEFRDTVTVRYVVQTDEPIEVAAALGDMELTLVPSPSSVPNAMRAMAGAHAHAIATADRNERVVLLNADIMISEETFVAVERRFRSGKKAVVCSGTRTVLPWHGRAPQPTSARALHQWSMRHAHPITQSCVWGRGRCHLPWGIYFRENDSVVLRAFHLHPLAVLADRPLPFGGTIDLDLIDNYRHEEIHLVTDADELCMAEISPPQKYLGDNPWPIDVGQVLAWALRGARPMHWWNFRHRIVVTGSPESVKCDVPVADEVLRLCPYPEAIAAPI